MDKPNIISKCSWAFKYSFHNSILFFRIQKKKGMKYKTVKIISLSECFKRAISSNNNGRHKNNKSSGI